MCGIAALHSPITRTDWLDSFIDGPFARVNHRGTSSAGITAMFSDGSRPLQIAEPGQVREMCSQRNPQFTDFSKTIVEECLTTFVGQTRYPTQGYSVNETQPIVMQHPDFGWFCLAHNGQIVGHEKIRSDLQGQGCVFQGESDSEVLAAYVARSSAKTLSQALAQVVEQIPASFSILACSSNELVGARDRHGIRPLWRGNTDDDLVSFASEKPALTGVVKNITEVLPGEVVSVDLTSNKAQFARVPFSDQARPMPCLFEIFYLARPDGVVDSTSVANIRYLLGEALGEQNTVQDAMVVGVPDSGLPAARGYAEASDLRFFPNGITRNRYARSGRSFLESSLQAREDSVRRKITVSPEMVRGRIVIVVDDTIVRSTTSRTITQMLREQGAREVHWRIPAPPVVSTCVLGIDMPSQSDLVAHTCGGDLSRIADAIGANSVEYLSLEQALSTIAHTNSDWCTGCLGGEYPPCVQLEM